jgi:hypothetical protein
MTDERQFGTPHGTHCDCYHCENARQAVAGRIFR